MTTAVIVQARLGSSRLPAKVLLPLPTGRTVLEEVLHRCKQIPGVDVVVAAIPDTKENDIVAHFAVKELNTVRRGEVGFEETIAAMKSRRLHKVVRGPEHDVLARYVKAAEAVNGDVVMRVTSDCPLIDPDVCSQVLRARVRTNGGIWFSCNNSPRTFPVGLDCEAFGRELLDLAAAEATCKQDREHVTVWMRRHSNIVQPVNVASPVNRCESRWTLDTLEDYKVIWNVFEQQMRDAA